MRLNFVEIREGEEAGDDDDDEDGDEEEEELIGDGGVTASRRTGAWLLTESISASRFEE